MLTSLFKRSGVYFIGLVGGRVLTTLTWIILARLMAKEIIGQAVLYLLFLEITTFAADFGLNQWYQKHVEDKKPDEFFQKILSARTFTLVVSMFVLSVYLTLTASFPPEIVLIFVISLLPRALLSIADGYYLEKKQSTRLAIKTIMYMLLFLIGFTLFRSSFTFLLLVLVYLGALSITALWYFPWHTIRGFRLESFPAIKKILSGSSAYALLIITSFFYARGDSIIVGYMAGASAVASYGMAYRYLEVISLFPSALTQNLFPLSAKKAGIPFDVLKRMFLVLTLFGMITGVTLYLIAPLLIVTLLGAEYADAVPVLQILAGVSTFFFMSAPLSTVVQSSALVRQFLPFGIANTLLNIALNMLFIPSGGIEAAAWVMLTTEVSGLLINVFFVKKIYTK